MVQRASEPQPQAPQAQSRPIEEEVKASEIVQEPLERYEEAQDDDSSESVEAQPVDQVAD